MTDAVCVAHPVLLSTAFFVFLFLFNNNRASDDFSRSCVAGTVSKDAC